MANEACTNALRSHLSNPFFVLEVNTDANRETIERQGAKLLAMLKAGIEEAGRYATPWGRHERTAEDIRLALAELRNPAARVAHEWWANGFSDGSFQPGGRSSGEGRMD